MTAEFTEEEKAILKGHLSGIAKKHHCSVMYVEYILKGQRQIKTPLSKDIAKDLKQLAKFLTPKSNS